MVEEAWVDNTTLIVKFLKGGIIAWNIQPQMLVYPEWGNLKTQINPIIQKKSDPLNMPSNNKVCLINQAYNDQKKRIFAALNFKHNYYGNGNIRI